ncbi:hypothetical protein N7466_008195 [Penicillium verhagenii]|uniref:uncharacterized protein n=1 Tax=Penicillium verhagenii TaxID=1562060 RepID=UPI0025457917|nr:uncharacterized protein N7466_008195 [Penicillium verhagenii]KAJ5924008.1 hypothetical protein N7466_008195 [Penicillium verhagenii]
MVDFYFCFTIVSLLMFAIAVVDVVAYKLYLGAYVHYLDAHSQHHTDVAIRSATGRYFPPPALPVPGPGYASR